MNDNIELHSHSRLGHNDSEEYHEINESAIYTETIEDTDTESPTTQIKFFTKSKQNRKTKKKTQQNVMDIINTKIAAESLPITENVLHFKNESQKLSYLQNKYKLNKILHIRPRTFDVEHAVRKRLLKLSAIFPTDVKCKSKENFIYTRYVEPRFFDDLVSGVNTKKEIDNFLDISVNGIQFNHHHTFSLEKILAMKLEKYYFDYVEFVKHIKNLLRAIDVNRETRENLKEKFTNVSPKKEKDIRFDATILKYTHAFLKCKEEYLEKIEERRKLVNIILLLWSDLKKVRRNSSCTNTACILEVEKNMNEDVFIEEWGKLFHNEYTDMLIELEYSYINRYLEYKKMKTDEKCLRKIVKPTLEIEPERIKREVEARVKILLNSEDVSVCLKFNKKILKLNSNAEIDRNEKDMTVYLKIYVDNVFVCESDHMKVEDFSQVNFNDSFTLQLLQNNKTLTLVLCEGNENMSASTMDLHEIHKKSVILTEIQFLYEKVIVPTSSSIGNGYEIEDIAAPIRVRLKSIKLFEGKLYSSCKIKLKVSWDESLNGNQSSPIKHCINIEKRIHRILHGVEEAQTSNLLEILKDIYDMEIEDENIIHMLNELCQKTIADRDTFTDDINSIRFRLLRLRNSSKFSNINKAIPLYESQITTEQLNSLENSDARAFDVEYFERKRGSMDPIDLQRYMGVKFIEKLNDKIINELNESLMRKTHKDVVKDYEDLSLRSIFSKKSNIALGSSNVAMKQFIEEGLAKEQEIFVTVLRAFNLFDRSEAEEENHENIAGYRVRLLRPFVRVSYNTENVQTSTAMGNNPTWNYTAKIKTKLKPLSSIYVNIFDEHKVNVCQESEQSFHCRCHNKWLGTLSIPISTVLNLGTIRGTFKIATPPIILGYGSAPKETTSVIPEVIQLMKKETAFITLRLTTSLSHLGGLQSYHQPCDTDDHILRHLNGFVTEYLNAFPARSLSLTFIDSGGKNKCVTELIQPLPLPDIKLTDPNIRLATSSRNSSPKEKLNAKFFELTAMSKLVTTAARYVSLIPTYEVIQCHVVTLMGIELLKVLYGSPLDHTLLLASYFLQLGIKCYVVIGYGLPLGLSSYVLVKYDKDRIIMTSDIDVKGCDIYIYEAVSGERYGVRDVGSPLKTISYVFDNENIWVNIQSYQDCENLSFDFTKSSNWQTVFDRTVFVLKQPAITTDVYYPPRDVAELRDNLDAKIKAKIQKWRWNVKTIWNRYLSNILVGYLAQLEFWSFGTTAEKPSPEHELKKLMETYKIFGFPINTPYVNTKSVISRVKSTMLHVNDDPNAEFGLAVELYAYPNNVLSVWVFLASITRA